MTNSAADSTRFGKITISRAEFVTVEVRDGDKVTITAGSDRLLFMPKHAKTDVAEGDGKTAAGEAAAA